MPDKCTVKVGEENKEAIFYGVFQYSYVKQELLIGDVGGVVAYPVAVVDWGEGPVELNLSVVSDVRTFNDVKGADLSIDAIRNAMDGSKLGQSISQSIGQSMRRNDRGGQL